MEQLVLDKKEEGTVALEGTKRTTALFSSPVPKLTLENFVILEQIYKTRL